jgi:hypothetical protein
LPAGALERGGNRFSHASAAKPLEISIWNAITFTSFSERERFLGGTIHTGDFNSAGGLVFGSELVREIRKGAELMTREGELTATVGREGVPDAAFLPEHFSADVPRGQGAVRLLADAHGVSFRAAPGAFRLNVLSDSGFD